MLSDIVTSSRDAGQGSKPRFFQFEVAHRLLVSWAHAESFHYGPEKKCSENVLKIHQLILSQSSSVPSCLLSIRHSELSSPL